MYNPQVYNTGDVGSQFTTFLVYGLAGSGKTPVAATLSPWSPLVITSEPGLLSLKAAKLPYVQVQTHKQALDVAEWLKKSREAAKYGAVYFDSISAISEAIFDDRKKHYKNDARKFSPETTSQTMEVIREYLTIPGKHIAMTSKGIEEIDALTQTRLIYPFAAVPKLGPALPYYFDNVFCLSRKRDAATGQEMVYFSCRENDYAKSCRNRLGNLDLYEPADLGYIINKINAAT